MRKTKLYQSCHASRPRSCHRSHRRRGITSACAEQTASPTRSTRCDRDHLRVCGADWQKMRESYPLPGSPPRVRSRRRGRRARVPRAGITSACAEQTTRSSCGTTTTWDHLRVCGADVAPLGPCPPLMGSPPRVRSRQGRTGARLDIGRITSACAEQIRCTGTWPWAPRDHLRVCGADIIRHLTPYGNVGSPPRVRSRPAGAVHRGPRLGITSACAEQTPGAGRRWGRTGDHLRVCGADDGGASNLANIAGSPPRVRSRPGKITPVRGWVGITSACAEQTGERSTASSAAWDHLRVCGADTVRRGA